MSAATPAAPIPAEQLLGLLFIAACAEQGISVERAARMLSPETIERIDAQRRELELSQAEAKKSKRTKKAD